MHRRVILALAVTFVSIVNSAAAMKLDSEQKQVLTTALTEAHRFGATPREQKALVEALLVESGIRNLTYGSGTSIGALQQQPNTGWPHAGNVKLATRDFLTAARKIRGTTGSAGKLAQGVQRSGVPGAYDLRSGDAASLLQGHAARVQQSYRVGNVRGKPTLTKRALLAQYLQRVDPGNTLVRSGVIDPNETTTPVVHRQSARSAQTSAASTLRENLSSLLELFYDPQGGWKNGQSIGAIGGHSDHVHVAAGQKTVVVLGKIAQQMGLKVGENSHFDGGLVPTSGHAPNSYHYKDQAIDVSGDPQVMSRFAHYVRHIYNLK